MKLVLVVAALFLAGAVYNLLGPERNVTEALGGLAIAALLAGVFAFMRAQRRRDDAFLAWVDANRADIDGRGARYGTVLITPETELRQYEMVASFLIVSLRIPSRLHVTGDDASLASALAFTAITLVLGWWGIPWGPLYTVRAVWRNARGGTRRTVGELLAAGAA